MEKEKGESMTLISGKELFEAFTGMDRSFLGMELALKRGSAEQALKDAKARGHHDLIIRLQERVNAFQEIEELIQSGVNPTPPETAPPVSPPS